MRTTFLPFCLPAIGEQEIAAASAALQTPWLSTGPLVRELEQKVAEFVGAPAGLALSSGTAALHLALIAVGVKPGERVITTPMTFCSSVHVIEHAGAVPVMADVEPDTLNIDPNAVRRILRSPGPRVAALMPVHLYGHPCDMDALVAIAEEFGIPLVEDAAHALPAGYHGRLVGSGWGARVPALTCFSFYATKNLTTGEGGMLTGPAALVEEARGWSLHGMSRDAFRRYTAEGSWRYEVLRPGFKYNLTDPAAAIGLTQLSRLPELQARRAAIVARYNDAFGAMPDLETPTTRPDVQHAHHLYVLRLHLERFAESAPGAARAQFIEELKARRIGTSVHFIPVHVHPYYRDKYAFAPEAFPVAWQQYQRIVSLPLFPSMSDADVDDVIEAVRESLAALPRKAMASPAAPGSVPSPAGAGDDFGAPVPLAADIPGKRAFDIVVSLLVLILGAPIWLLIVLAIRLDSRGPIIHRTRRIGHGWRPFEMLKFRSMIVDAEKAGPGVTLPGDARVTRVGRVLRVLKLDEMPQLFNILRGEMSIVGPRPEGMVYARLYSLEQRRVASVRPGLTNPAMIKYRHEQELLAEAGGDPEERYRTVHLPDRLRLDLEYIDNRSLTGDIRILIAAFASLFRRKTAAPASHPIAPPLPQDHRR